MAKAGSATNGADCVTREVKYSDPNMYHEGVLSYREQFDLTPNAGFRRDIVATIRTHDDLLLWQDLLAHWGYMDRQTGKWKPRNPLDVKGMLTVFEMKQRENEKRQLERINGHNQTPTVSARRRKGLSPRRNSELPAMRIQPPSDYFRVD